MHMGDREAFIALIAPIGIDINQVVDVLSEQIKQISYEPNTIKLTDFLRDLGCVEENYPDEVARYKAYIEAGDKLCEDAQRGDILVTLGIAKLLSGGPERRKALAESPRINIIRQIKRLDEYNTLERTYGRNILFLGCYASKNKRISYLVDRLRVSDRESNESALESKALDIIATDEEESGKRFGQKVVDCYPKSDFIIDCSSLHTLEESCKRFLQIYFGHPFISPSRDEYCSYVANAAAYRSLDLSRQVGAAIFGKEGEILSMGCNEVPAPGGGTYWCDETQDGRDYILGYDSNQRVKEDLARDALDKLKRANWLDPKIKEIPLSQLVDQAFEKNSNGDEGPWTSAMMSNIIEYGRMVHAEMNAITDAARFRRSTIGTTLYCTTMPCHMCTKLIIASGITRVVYVQPYVKSLAGELFKDSIVFDGHEFDHRVNFQSLRGVTPAGFKRAFARSGKRKKTDGSAIKCDKLNARPNFLTDVPYYLVVELQHLKEIQENSVVERFARAATEAAQEG